MGRDFDPGRRLGFRTCCCFAGQIHLHEMASRMAISFVLNGMNWARGEMYKAAGPQRRFIWDGV